MMIVLVDADIVLEGVLGQNTLEVQSATEMLWELMRSEQILGLITVIGLDRIKIVLRRIHKPEEDIEMVTISIQELMEVCPINENIWKEAQRLSDMDFETALELVCAQKNFVDVIVAKNPQDFPQGDFCVYSVDELVEILHYANEIQRARIQLEEIYTLPSETVNIVAIFGDSSNINLAEHRALMEGNTVNLMQWFRGVFEEGWQAVNEVVSPQLRPAFMNLSAKQERGKSVDIGLDLAGHYVALIMTVEQLSEEGFSVWVQVYPTGNQRSLPPHLNLAILDESGEVFKEVNARSDDECIRYKFEAESGDKFGVKVALGDASVTENFQL